MTYLGGATIVYSTWALVTDGQDYVIARRAKFPSLNSKQERQLLTDIIDKIYTDQPEWIRTDVMTIFEDLLERVGV